MPDNLAPVLEGVMWSLTAISVIIVALRFYTRGWIVRRIDWDDWVMLLCLALMLADDVLVQIAISYGLGRQQDTLSDEDAITAIRFIYMSQPPAIIGPAFGRISFAMLLLTLVKNLRPHRILLWFLIVSQFVVNNLVYILILTQCTPIESLWDYRIPDEERSCWDLRHQANIGFFQGSLNGATDLVLALFPIVIVWNLQMKTAQKVSLAILMGLGVFAMVGSIMKTVYLPSVGSRINYTYNTAPLITWWMVEGYLVIIAASVATLRPLMNRARNQRPSTSKSAYGLRTFGSSRPKGYQRNAGDTNDEFPLTYDGLDTIVPQPRAEANHDQAYSEVSEEHGDGIRKTVNISVDVNHR